MHKNKILLNIIGLAVTIFFLSQFPVHAVNNQYLSADELKSFGFAKYENINPNMLIYPIKRVKEGIRLNLIFDKQKKQDYVYQLYEVRFKELLYIVNNKKEGFLSFAADRYNSFVGSLKKEEIENKDFKKKIEDKIKFLERLRDIYPANSENWSKLQQTIDTTKSLI